MMEKQISILRKEIDKKFKTDISSVNKEMNDQYMNILNMTKLQVAGLKNELDINFHEDKEKYDELKVEL